MLRFSIITVLFLIIPSTSYSAVDLPWTTSYPCVSEWTTYGALPSGCSEIDPGLNVTCDPAGDALYEIISTSSNMAAGEGGMGQRHWQGIADIGEGIGVNDQSGGTNVAFNTTQNELWIRFYMRYQEGYKQRADSIGDKFIYPQGGPWVQWIGFDAVNISDGTNHIGVSGKGWNYVMSSGATDSNGNKLSDGLWHLYEVHIKSGVGTSTAEMWIDEELVLQHTSITLAGNWDFVAIGSNQKYPDNAGCEYVDFDDIAINNTGYIGPLKLTRKVKSGSGTGSFQ